MKNQTCAFTGLRPHKLPFAEGSSNVSQLFERMEHTVQEAIDKGYCVFLCGGAMGGDLWLGEIVISLRESNPRIQLHCILPFEGQADGWPDNWKARYNRVLERCDHVEYVQQRYTCGCYFQRNRAMVDRSSLLIALHDGGTSGGTAYTIAYARNKGVDTVIMNPR